VQGRLGSIADRYATNGYVLGTGIDNVTQGLGLKGNGKFYFRSDIGQTFVNGLSKDKSDVVVLGDGAGVRVPGKLELQGGVKVSSTQKVDNLNADLIDGLDSSALGKLDQPQTWKAPQAFPFGLSVAGSPIIAETGTGDLVRNQTPTIHFPSVNGLRVSGGIDPNGSGLQHRRVAIPLIEPHGVVQVVVPFDFADGSYTLTCTAQDDFPGDRGLQVQRMQTRQPTLAIIRVTNDSDIALGGLLHCIAIHDWPSGPAL
jgi:hypothetical protein